LNQVAPILQISNSGTLISSLTVKSVVNGQQFSQSFSGLNFSGNSMIQLQLASMPLTDDENEISFELTEPDNKTDFNPADNTLQTKVIVDKDDDRIPLRQNFEGSFNDEWTSTSPSRHDVASH
jgi:hypothetical protein